MSDKNSAKIGLLVAFCLIAIGVIGLQINNIHNTANSTLEAANRIENYLGSEASND